MKNIELVLQIFVYVGTPCLVAYVFMLLHNIHDTVLRIEKHLKDKDNK